jgi:hypothetical protein
MPTPCSGCGCAVRALLSLVSGDLGSALSSLREARLLADRAGAAFARAMADLFAISALSQTGHVERTAEAARELSVFSEPLGPGTVTDWTTFFLAWARVAADEAADAIVPLRALLNRADQFLVCSARATLVQALLACGDTDGAEREAFTSVEGILLPWSQASVLRSRALVELRLDRPQSALALAEQGLEAAMQASYPLTVSLLRLTHADALHALGRFKEAQTAICEARNRILQIALTLDDLELRVSYLTRVQVHARTLTRARDWLGEV